MTDVLLISEKFIKTNSGISDNVWGSYLTPAIREAQDIRLQRVIGGELYNTLLSIVENGTIAEEEFSAYRTLLDDYIQVFLMYQVISDLIPIIGVKLANLGTVVSNDEHVENLSASDRERTRAYYELRADFYCRRMQEWLLANRDAFPELDAPRCDEMASNLRSAASTGLWLGGRRGYKTV